MRRLVAVIAVAALVAACGGKSTSVSLSAPNTSASHPSATATTSRRGSTPISNAGPTYHYPAAVRNALMARCRKGGSRSACGCVVRYFEGNFSYARIKAASIPKLAQWAAKAAAICSGV